MYAKKGSLGERASGLCCFSQSADILIPASSCNSLSAHSCRDSPFAKPPAGISKECISSSTGGLTSTSTIELSDPQ